MQVFVLSMRFLPPVAIAIPFIVIYLKLGIYDSLGGLVLVYLVTTISTVIWLSVPAFERVPREVEEAAAMEGCSDWEIFRRFSLPIAAPSLFGALVFPFVLVWNELLLVLTLAAKNATLSVEIPDHAFVVFLGPCGCGKSTMLRMIAGLEEVSSGRALIGGSDVTDLPPGQRGVAMVFQSYALYPHMSVADNIAFGLRRLGMDKAEIATRLAHVAQLLGLDTLLDRKPKNLSAGQQQRVAMARAMIKTPKVFLFDDPLSNLDAKLREKLRTEIRKIHLALKTTTIFVTHDQLEAMTITDRIVLMRAGKIDILLASAGNIEVLAETGTFASSPIAAAFRDTATLNAYASFSGDAEQAGAPHVLEVFNPNLTAGLSAAETGLPSTIASVALWPV